MSWKKRLASLLLAVCLMVGMFPAMASAVDTEETVASGQAAGMPFTDVKQGEWYYDAVSYVYENNLMVGTSDTLFTPQGMMNRAMVAQILYSMEGRPAVSGSPAFRDVSSGAWYYNAIQWASQNNVAAGTGNGLFNPTGKVTREQFAQFLYSYAGKPEVQGTLDFPDAGNVSGWAVNAVTWATQNKLINGNKKPDGQLLLEPTGKTTRAQAAVILRGFCENVIGQENQEVYSITDLTVSGKTVTVEVTAAQTCTVQVDFLNETTEKALNVTATASVPADTEMGTVTATTTGMLPTHFIAIVRLLDADGKQLCSQFKCIRYTTNYEKFEAQTVDDFEGETVLNFDDDKTNNFGVLADSVKEPTAASGKNVISENEDGTYIVNNIDATVGALKPGDEALFYDAKGEPVLVSIGTIKRSGTTATIARNADVTLSEYYQVLKLDMAAEAAPDDVDMSGADDGVTLKDPKQSRTNSETAQSAQQNDGTVRSDQKNMDIINEDVEESAKLEFGLDYASGHLKISGKVLGSISAAFKAVYDVKLFGEDYAYVKCTHTMKGTISGEMTGTSSDADKEDIEQIKLGEANIPFAGGLKAKVAVTAPVTCVMEGTWSSKVTFFDQSGFSYCSTDGGPQKIKQSYCTVALLNVEGKAEATIGIKGSISVDFLETITAAFTAEAGVKGTVKAATDIGITISGEDSLHACQLCLEISAQTYINAGVSMSWQINDKLKGTLFKITIFEVTSEPKKAHASLLNDTDSIYGGNPDLGWGDCENKKYRVTFHVLDEEGNAISGAVVTIAKKDTVNNGGDLYLYNGTYTATSTVGDQTLTETFYVLDEAMEVTLKKSKEESTDPDEPDPIDPAPADPDPIDPIDPNPPDDPSKIVASGTCGDNLKWVLDDEGILYITGTGKMSDWLSGNDPWSRSGTKYKIKKIAVGNSVTSISNYAFSGCSNLTTVSIGDSVTDIGIYAFHGCSSLTSVSIGKSVISIGTSAFYNCSSLTGVTIPDSVTSIGISAFSGCSSMTRVTIGKGVTNIGKSAFYGCKSLTGVIIPGSVTSLGDSAFSGCSSITSITIPDGVTSLGSGIFCDCSKLTSVRIPYSVTDIGDRAFRSCYRLKNIYYTGSEAQWAAVAIGSSNDPLTSATIHYNS